MAHMLFWEGVYFSRPDGLLRFRWVKAPTSAELTQLAGTIARRVSRFLERPGLLERDAEKSWLASDDLEDGSMSSVLGHSITCRIAVALSAGRKVITLQALPGDDPPFWGGSRPRGRSRPVSDSEEETPAAKRAGMTWVQRLKRVFDIDVQTCDVCGGAVKSMAAIEDPVTIKKILGNMVRQGAMPQACHRPKVRGRQRQHKAPILQA